MIISSRIQEIRIQRVVEVEDMLLVGLDCTTISKKLRRGRRGREQPKERR